MLGIGLAVPHFCLFLSARLVVFLSAGALSSVRPSSLVGVGGPPPRIFLSVRLSVCPFVCLSVCLLLLLPLGTLFSLGPGLCLSRAHAPATLIILFSK